MDSPKSFLTIPKRQKPRQSSKNRSIESETLVLHFLVALNRLDCVHRLPGHGQHVSGRRRSRLLSTSLGLRASLLHRHGKHFRRSLRSDAAGRSGAERHPLNVRLEFLHRNCTRRRRNCAGRMSWLRRGFALGLRRIEVDPVQHR